MSQGLKVRVKARSGVRPEAHMASVIEVQDKDFLPKFYRNILTLTWHCGDVVPCLFKSKASVYSVHKKTL